MQSCALRGKTMGKNRSELWEAVEDLRDRLVSVETRLRVASNDIRVLMNDPSREDMDVTDEFNGDGMVGKCSECGAPYEVVGPGDVQETCRCDEVAALKAEVARVQREHEALLGYNERKCAENADLRQRLDEKTRAEINSPSQAVGDLRDRLVSSDSLEDAVVYAALGRRRAEKHLMSIGSPTWQEWTRWSDRLTNACDKLLDFIGDKTLDYAQQ